MSFIDLKIVSPICQSPPSTIVEAAHEYRENDFSPVNGFCHPLRVSEMRRSLRRQPQGDQFLLLGSVPLHGLRPAPVPREPARHSSLLPSGGTRKGSVNGRCRWTRYWKLRTLLDVTNSRYLSHRWNTVHSLLKTHVALSTHLPTADGTIVHLRYCGILTPKQADVYSALGITSAPLKPT